MKIKTILFLAIFSIVAASTAAQTKPVFDSYRGVKIGMSADEARKALGKAKEETDKEDYYEYDNGESARVFYDEDKKVRVISATFSKDLETAPQPKAVIGEEIEPREDGGMFKMVQYPTHGFWISYVKIAGDESMIIITMQKIGV